MHKSPPPPATCDTFSNRIWHPTARLIGSSMLFILFLFLAVPSFALEPAIESEAPSVASPDLAAAQQAAKERDAAMLLATADKLSAQTKRIADLIVEGKAMQLMKQLTLLDEATSTASDTIALRIDARLGMSLSRLHSVAFSNAPTPALSHPRKTHTPPL